MPIVQGVILDFKNLYLKSYRINVFIGKGGGMKRITLRNI